MIIGLALYPGALGFSGWNEKRAVCRQKALYQAEDKSILLSCSSSAADNGKPVHPGNLGFLSCALDKKTLPNYSKDDVPGLDLMSSNLFHAPGLGLKVKTEMVVCKEECIRSVCRGRRLFKQGRYDTEMEDRKYESFTQTGDDEVETFPEAGALTFTESETDTIPARRLKSGRRRANSCQKKCVEWQYRLDWSDMPGLSTFKDEAKASQNCTGLNPQEGSFRPALGIPNKYANPGQVKVQGGGWGLNQKQTESIPVEVPVALADTANLVQSPVQPPPSWSDANTMVMANQLHTCNIRQDADKKLGCMRLSAWVSRPERVGLLGEVSQTQGLMSEEGWKAPSDWLCSGQTVQRVCPSIAQIDVEGFVAGGGIPREQCGEISSREELFELMHGENHMTTWIFRLAGFLLTWLGICCICNPITTCVQMAGEFLEQITECIPGIGCIVDEMTDIFTGLVTSIICVVSCLCAFSSFVFVSGVMWVVMRPVLAIPLLILGLCVCGGAGFLMHTCRKKGSRPKGENEALLVDDS